MFESTVTKYESRGDYGDYRWKGNTSGFLVKDTIETFCQPDWLVLDPMQGSGTSGDVCKDTGNPYLGYDIKSGDDVLNPHTQEKIAREVKEASGNWGAGLVFFHPPYWNMLTYSQNINDFSAMPYNDYLASMQRALVFLSSVMRKGGVLALLLGDLRRNEQSYFITDDVCDWRKIKQAKLEKLVRIIKIQVNTNSGGETDLPVRLVHEYVTIFRKP